MKKTTQIAAATLCILIFVFVFYLQTFKMSPTSYQLPRILMLIIVFLAIAMFFETFQKEKKLQRALAATSESPEEGIQTEPEPVVVLHYKRIAVFIISIGAYIFSIKQLGYFIVTPIYIVGTFMYLKSVRLRTALIIAVIFTGFVYVLFIRFLHLPIPTTISFF